MAVAAIDLMAPSPRAGARIVSPARARIVSPARARTVSQLRPSPSTFRRRQVVAAGLVVGLVLAVWAALGVLGAGTLPVPGHPSQPVASAGTFTAPEGGAMYVVQPGDTFWSIAARVKPHADPRPLVDKLVAAHGGSTLHIGERIPIPS